ncbi:MAG: DUF6657 family protein [Bacillota bacterium]
MGEIKTAYEKAMERVEKMNIAGVDLTDLEYVPKGHTAAAMFLDVKDFNVAAELGKYEEDNRVFVKRGMEETFLRNIQLPRADLTQENNKRAMEGLMAIKQDRSALQQIFSELEYLFHYYEQSLEHAYANLKESYSARLEQAQDALERQTGTRVKYDVERHPGFQEEWLRTQGQLDSQYEAVLAEQKTKIGKIN